MEVSDNADEEKKEPIKEKSAKSSDKIYKLNLLLLIIGIPTALIFGAGSFFVLSESDKPLYVILIVIGLFLVLCGFILPVITGKRTAKIQKTEEEEISKSKVSDIAGIIVSFIGFCMIVTVAVIIGIIFSRPLFSL